tara:strand:- start:3314 stop:4492 length:1179 start_codon:yes stop_codon:yes gene_type:complete
MNNMYAGEPDKGIFNIRYDFDKSHGSYIFDKNTKKSYLDFFGMFSSIPIGYNHPIFDNDDFLNEIVKVSKFKIVNCEFLTDEYDRFYNKFMDFSSCGGKYVKSHFVSTGALAVECAVKAAIHHSKKDNPKILSVKNDFHGIMSYSNILTTRFWPITTKMDGFPGGGIWPHFETLDELNKLLSTDDSVAGVIVEPIQSTFGDNHLSYKFLKGIRDLCTQYEVPLIFDEIQTGFCATGKTWFFEHLDFYPDIVIFGKKAQVCGFMTLEEFSSILQTKILYTTWDSDLVDMIRSTYVMDVIDNQNLRESVTLGSQRFIDRLKDLDNIYNVRGKGCLIAFDFETQTKRDNFFNDLFESGMLCNPTGDKSVRLRPHLTITEEEFDQAYNLINGVLNE